MSTEELKHLARQLHAGDRRALARAITLVESTRPDHQEKARALLTAVVPHTGAATRIGISGVPGVGKSTFIEALGRHVIEQGYRVAVLAVDPSSTLTGGSILGDKTRMEELSRHEHAFVRPSPSRASTGGVARRTRESMLLCEAAGFDVVIVETVGVGQSETAVADMTDVFVLLLQPGGGDDLQGIKRGILELADVVLVNKADGALAEVANHSAADYHQALQLLPARTPGWQVPVKTCSARRHTGIEEAWKAIQACFRLLKKDSILESRRAEQAVTWMWRAVTDGLLDGLKQDSKIRARIEELEESVRRKATPPTAAAQELIDLFRGAG